MEQQKNFEEEIFKSKRNNEQQEYLKRLYLENECNTELYYLIVSKKLLTKYTFKEQIFLINKFIESEFNNNLHSFIKQNAICLNKYNLDQLKQLIDIAKKNKYDNEVINIMNSELWSIYRSFDELLMIIDIYLNSKPKENTTIGIIKKGHIIKNRTFNEQCILIYLYEKFIEYYYMYYLASEKDIIENRSFGDQLILMSAYLETKGNKKITKIIFDKKILKNYNCKYQLKRMNKYYDLSNSYSYLVENPNNAINDPHIQKVLTLDRYFNKEN